MSGTRRTARKAKPAYVRGELQPDVANAAVVHGPRDAWEVRVHWDFHGLSVTQGWPDADGVLHGQGNELYLFGRRDGAVAGYAAIRHGVSKVVLAPARDRVVVIGPAGVSAFDSRLQRLWEEDVPARDDVSFLRWNGRRFRIRAKNRPGDDWTEYEFHVDAGAMPNRKGGPGAQPVA